MSEGKRPEHTHHDTGPHAPHEQQLPYWKRAHKDWRFWVGVVFIAAAIVIYVLSLDLSSVPRHMQAPQHSVSGTSPKAE